MKRQNFINMDPRVAAGVKNVIGVLEGGEAPEAAENTDGKTAKSPGPGLNGPDLSITERILFGAFIFGIIGLFTAIGIMTPGVGWFLYFFLIPFWAMFPKIIVGATGALFMLGIYLVAFPIAKLLLAKTGLMKKAEADLRTKWRASIGGFTVSSGRSGESGDSGFSSGSGFSAPGGSSGGGGASGSW